MFTPLKQRDTMTYSLLFVFFLIVGCGGPERVALRGGTEHLLLLHRRTMRYVERKGSEERRFTIRMFYSGGRSVRAYELEVKGLDLGHCRFISKDQQVFFETNKPATTLADVPEFRQLWEDETANPSDGWEDSDTGTETVVASSETVTVPAGTFENCYKTVTTGTSALPVDMSTTAISSPEIWPPYPSMPSLSTTRIVPSRAMVIARTSSRFCPSSRLPMIGSVDT